VEEIVKRAGLVKEDAKPVSHNSYLKKDAENENRQYVHADSGAAANVNSIVALIDKCPTTVFNPYNGGLLKGEALKPEDLCGTEKEISERISGRFGDLIALTVKGVDGTDLSDFYKKEGKGRAKFIPVMEPNEDGDSYYQMGDMIIFKGDLLHAGWANKELGHRHVLFLSNNFGGTSNSDGQVHIAQVADCMGFEAVAEFYGVDGLKEVAERIKRVNKRKKLPTVDQLDLSDLKTDLSGRHAAYTAVSGTNDDENYELCKPLAGIVHGLDQLPKKNQKVLEEFFAVFKEYKLKSVS
jgi:hypothetical protein